MIYFLCRASTTGRACHRASYYGVRGRELEVCPGAGAATLLVLLLLLLLLLVTNLRDTIRLSVLAIMWVMIETTTTTTTTTP